MLTDDFFLATEGKDDPEAELQATLAAYSTSWLQDNPDSHARCRFPARYFWLSKQISLPEYSPQPQQCTRLAKWSLPDQVKSVSLFLVSGYLGNPASVFGHSLLKLNTDSRDDQAGLFDLTVNYGALVPEDEPALRYIANGITGGYQAGFSDRYFYTQDLVYSRTEFRDIWDYELHLSEEQKTFLVFHLWEILGKKFTYYFFDQNCAFRLAELLELVLEEPLLEHAAVWYAPVETFHRLEDIDRARKKQGKELLISSVRFIPSAQRALYHRFGLLDAEEKRTVQAVLRDGADSLNKHLNQIAEEQRPEVVDTLLAHSNCRLIAQAPAPAEELLQEKKELLLARLRLPPRTAPPAEVPARQSPAKGNRPQLTGLGIGHTPARNTYLRLHWAPFTQEGVGRNNLEGDELAVLDTVAGIGGEKVTIFIDRLDLLRIRKLKTDILPTDGENAWSWQLRTGMESVEENNTTIWQDVFFRFGAGRAVKIGDSITAYAMLDASAHSEQPHVRLFPHIGIVSKGERFGARFYAGGENIIKGDEPEPVYGAELQYGVSEQFAVALSAARRRKTKIAVELKWYW
ncbi:MAG: DUF4105 domain-containing protein [Candidatus Electrothrix sp. YB6]